MKYLYLHNLASTYYGECPYGTDSYEPVTDNCSTDESTSNGASIDNSTHQSTPFVDRSTEPSTRANYTHTTPMGEGPLWPGIGSASFAISTGGILFVIGIVLMVILLKRR